MAAKILFPERIVELVLKAVAGTDYSKGDLLGYSSGWVKADADLATNIYAQYVLLQGGKGGETVKACEKCLLHDTDAPWTANTAQYLSGTAGGTTETRPTTNGDLIQIVGRSLDTARCLIDIKKPQEFEIFFVPDQYDGTSEPGLGTLDTGWVGPQIDGATEPTYIKGKLPSGLVGAVSAARVIFNSIGASGFDCDVDIVASYDGGANNAIALSENTADWNADTDNILNYMDVSTEFGATVWLPRMNFCLWLDPDGITGDAQVIGLYLRGFKL
jgi:hypothetical protein